MPKPRQPSPLEAVLRIMSRLRAPRGCPWDQEQDHRSLRYHAVEEVYELIEAIEAEDDSLMIEELGDLLLQVVFHCQLGRERKAFDFDAVCRHLADKLVRRHPHVFGKIKVKTVAGVWAQWEQIKRSEKQGTRHARPSALDGIPRHLPALLWAEKLVKKARKAGWVDKPLVTTASRPRSPQALGRQLFALSEWAQRRGWNAEEWLRAEARRQERRLRIRERRAESRRRR